GVTGLARSVARGERDGRLDACNAQRGIGACIRRDPGGDGARGTGGWDREAAGDEQGPEECGGARGELQRRALHLGDRPGVEREWASRLLGNGRADVERRGGGWRGVDDAAAFDRADRCGVSKWASTGLVPPGCSRSYQGPKGLRHGGRATKETRLVLAVLHEL